ncbi:MAG: enoyl-CoA hydratase-related protein [Syntrophales bacterium]|nr:enoyl-CoA hydratase-related protein [Syntrophales bacterium]MDD5532375.1 enoyl-CoA hydratase-related protein [Syntrophales bacterium]
MTYNTINYVKAEGIGIITLNRPKSMNSLSSELLREMAAVLAEIADDDEVRVVILTGSEKFFAAGADIAEISNMRTAADAHRFLKTAHAVFNGLEDLEKPVIAAISGLALGGGCELLLACDLRICAEDAVFGQPEIKIGVIPGAGGTQRLPRVIGLTKAKELLYTGDSMDAGEALRAGLVSKVVPVGAVLDEAKALAKKIARLPAIALRVTKDVVNTGMNLDLKSAMLYEARCFEMLFDTEDQKEGMSAFVEKRKPVFKGK